MTTELAVRRDDGAGTALAANAAVPPRQPWWAAAGRALPPLTLVTLAVWTAVAGSDLSSGSCRGMMAGLVLLTMLCAVTGRTGSARLGVGLTATVAAGALLPWQLGWWPLPGLIGAGAYILLHRAARRGRTGPHALHLGRLTAAEVWIVVGIAIASASALLVFSRQSPPHLGTGARFVLGLTPWSLAAAGLAFALVNAFVEEVLFRGAVLHHLGRIMGSLPAVLVQALAFGMLHFNGYPYGVTGVALASVYGLALGALRLRTGGLLAPWIAHVCADSVIFVLIVQAAT
jgi:uncharacterized protein